jgi:hypothetical protein
MTPKIYRNPALQADVNDPQWQAAGPVHDWRNHVGEGVQAIWHTFTDAQRMALAAAADERASREHWE